MRIYPNIVKAFVPKDGSQWSSFRLFVASNRLPITSEQWNLEYILILYSFKGELRAVRLLRILQYDYLLTFFSA